MDISPCEFESRPGHYKEKEIFLLFVFYTNFTNFAFRNKTYKDMEFEGTVFRIMPPTSGQSARGAWQRQEVIFDMKSQSQFPRKICVTFFNKPEEVARLVIGTEYTVSIDVESREYNGKWYTDVRAWRINPKAQTPPTPAGGVNPPAYNAPMPTEEPAYVQASQEVDDLPF